MKLAHITCVLLALIIPIKSVNAEPKSCKNLAVTSKEMETVNLLQEMHYVQLEMNNQQDKLDELKLQTRQDYDSYDSNSVDAHNQKVEEYNAVVHIKNKLSREFNKLKNSYNLLVDEISPSTNTSFTLCLNTQVLAIGARTTVINVDALDNNLENTRNNIENLNREIENLRRSLE